MNPRHLIPAALFVLIASSANAQKPRDKAAPAPPPVVSQKVEVQRGQTIAIPLGIHGVRGEQLEFLIRTPPRYGRMSSISSRGANTAVVKYTASAKSGATGDRFAYAVRGSEGVSAPGLVIINFVEPVAPPGKLVAPAELEFPAVVTGERSTVEMELANRGDGVAEGDAQVPLPWSLEGSGRYRIDPGGKVTMKLAFQVEKAGTYRGDVVLSGPTRSIITLRALAEERFTVSPPQLDLVAQPGSQTRTGILHVSNRSREEVKVQLVAGPRLLTDRAVVIAARAEAEIPIFAEAGEVSAINEQVTLSSGEWSASIPVRASAVGPILRFASGDPVFGKVTAGDAADGVAKLENLGGQTVAVRLEVGPPFQLRTQTAMVPANGTVDIAVRLPSVDSGMHKAKLSARADGQVASVEISAEVPEGPGTLAPETPAAPPARDDSAKEAGQVAQEQTAIYPNSLKEHPNGLGHFVREIQPASAVIAWPASLGGAASPRIEVRNLSLAADSELELNWTPFDGVLFRQDGDRMRAELTGLQPAALHTMRVVADHGDTSEVVFTVQFWTPARKPSFQVNWRLVGLVAAVAAFLSLVWRRRKSQGGAGW